MDSYRTSFLGILFFSSLSTVTWAQDPHTGHKGHPKNEPLKTTKPTSTSNPASMPSSSEEHRYMSSDEMSGVSKEDMPMMHKMMNTEPLGLSMSRDGSGTSWLPDSTPMYGLNSMVGDWMLMFHENIFGGVVSEGGVRGDTQLNSINWFMGMAQGSVLGGQLTARTMLSLELLTVGDEGYPLLLQTGEGLVDRQHPHDLFMEVAASYKHRITDKLGAFVYGGPAAEPALGPTAFPHRVSALPMPFAPISHHWLDSTHISFGVLTAGLYTSTVMIEGSLFNGREPDNERADFDLGPLDSFSGRLTIAPTSTLTAQASLARLREPEPNEPSDQTRATTSLTYNKPMAQGGNFANTLALGANLHEDTISLAVLAETTVDVKGPNVFFGRAEVVGKSAEELQLAGDGIFPVVAATAGYLYEHDLGQSFLGGVGVEVNLSLVPDSLVSLYGSQALPGGFVFIRLSPAEMKMHQMPTMASN